MVPLPGYDNFPFLVSATQKVNRQHYNMIMSKHFVFIHLFTDLCLFYGNAVPINSEALCSYKGAQCVRSLFSKSFGCCCIYKMRHYNTPTEQHYTFYCKVIRWMGLPGLHTQIEEKLR